MKRILSAILSVVMLLACFALPMQAATTEPAPLAIAGDVDGNEEVNSGDAIYLLRYTVMPSRYPLNHQTGDMNGDGAESSDDAIYLLRHTLLAELYPLKNEVEYEAGDDEPEEEEPEVNAEETVPALFLKAVGESNPQIWFVEASAVSSTYMNAGYTFEYDVLTTADVKGLGAAYLDDSDLWATQSWSGNYYFDNFDVSAGKWHHVSIPTVSGDNRGITANRIVLAASGSVNGTAYYKNFVIKNANGEVVWSADLYQNPTYTHASGSNSASTRGQVIMNGMTPETGTSFGIKGVYADADFWRIDLYLLNPSDKFWGDAWFGVYDRSVSQETLRAHKGLAGLSTWDYVWSDQKVHSGMTVVSITSNKKTGMSTDQIFQPYYPNGPVVGNENLKVILFYSDGASGDGYLVADQADVSLVNNQLDWGITNVTVNEAAGTWKIDLYINNPNAVFYGDAWFGVYDRSVTQQMLRDYRGEAGLSTWKYVWPDMTVHSGRTEFSISNADSTGLGSGNKFYSKYNGKLTAGCPDLKVILFYSDGASGDGYLMAGEKNVSLAETENVKMTLSNPINGKYSTVYKNTGVEDLDFVLEVNEGKTPNILFLTDSQLLRLEGARAQRYTPILNVFYRTTDRNSFVFNEQARHWDYVEEAIRKAGNPDLIVFGGDNVYGETDDNGAIWTEFCQRMDSYQIPWCVIWGNHDVETQLGVRWQIQQVQKSAYGFMEQGNKDSGGKGGNSNYTVGVKQGEELSYLLYMIDTNGAHVKTGGESLLSSNPDIGIINQGDGMHESQAQWIENSYYTLSQSFGELPTMWFVHIPLREALTAWQVKYPATATPNKSNPLNANLDGDSGQAQEKMCNSEGVLWDVLKASNCKAVFMGHDHINAANVSWNGIQFVYGLKTGTFDYHDYNGKLLGSTLIQLKADTDKPAVTYQYSDIKYTWVPGPGN